MRGGNKKVIGLCHEKDKSTFKFLGILFIYLSVRSAGEVVMCRHSSVTVLEKTLYILQFYIDQ